MVTLKLVLNIKSIIDSNLSAFWAWLDHLIDDDYLQKMNAVMFNEIRRALTFKTKQNNGRVKTSFKY